MDQPVPRRQARRIVIMALIALTVLAGVLALWQLAPRGLQAPLANTRIATVEQGMFRDDVALRATALPLHSVVLDAVESGRVEEVMARDGALVQQGDVLFRLSNPQRRLDLLQRESEHAQQISNLTTLRVAAQASRAERQRRADDLAFALTLAHKQHQRNLGLAQQGFVSAAALEDSTDRLAQQQRASTSDRSSSDTESLIQRDALRQMGQAIARLEAGLQLVNATVDALSVRAPVSGRLTDFRLQVGQTVRPDQHLGRVDNLDHFKLSAQVDEYYLNRIATGRQGAATINGVRHPLTVSRIYPQIKEGRFTLELAFERQPAALHPGQSMEVTITLGGARPALLLPNDAWLNDSGGLAAYVLDRSGTRAQRRPIGTGRRNPGQVEVLSGLVAGDRVLVSSYAGYGNAPQLQMTD